MLTIMQGFAGTRDVTQLILLIIGLVYLDFAIWYSASMHNLWSEKKRKYKGVLGKLWDRMV